MAPLVRNYILLYCLAGCAVIGWLTVRSLTSNFTALHSWIRLEGRVSSYTRPVRIIPSTDERVGFEQALLVAVDHTFGLKDSGKVVALFQDPNDPKHLKTAGFLQMWLFPAWMMGLILALLGAAALTIWLGNGHRLWGPEYGRSQWMYTPAPGPLPGGIVLHSPPSYWKIAVGWSLLAIVLTALGWRREDGEDFNLMGDISSTLLCAAFVMTAWGVAYRDVTLELSADASGVRISSVSGWRDVPWEMVHGLENQSIFMSYYNGVRLRQLPDPGAKLNVYAFTDADGRTLISFGRDLVPDEAKARLFQLCKDRTGASVKKVDRPIDF